MRSLHGGRWALLLTALFFCNPSFSQNPDLCAACHGPDGNSTTSGVPSIAGQPKLFIEHQLILFREGVRVSEQMYPVTKGLKDADIVRLAEHFSKLPAKPATGKGDPGLMKQGMAKAKQLRCGQCHGAQYAGYAQMPRLAGQREDYLDAEMRAYRDNKRTGGDTIMAAALYGVSDADIKALAHFLSRSR
jgi:cytochrome c553